MTAKTTYTATSTYTGETVTRTSAREYTYALDVNVEGFDSYTIPAGTYFVETGKRAHKINRETGTRGYWNTISQDTVIPAQEATAGIASFHGTREAAEKAGRALVASVEKSRAYTLATYGIDRPARKATYALVPTTV